MPVPVNTGRRPATPTAAAAVAPVAAPASCPPARCRGPRIGASAVQDIGPTVHQSLPRDTFRKARTIAGSNCSPAHAASSRRAAGTLIGFLYERAAVITSKESATLTIRAANEICSPSRSCGYPPPPNRSWCCSIAWPHGPSHGSSGSAMRAPIAGCAWSCSHSLASGRPGLLRIRAGTWILPTSCNSAAQRSRSRSWVESFSWPATRSVNARTRSLCPRVFRSWAESAATSARICSAARTGSGSTPRSRASLIRISSLRTLPAPRAIAKREGARSGNTSESRNRTASGRKRFPRCSAIAVAAVESRTRPTPHGISAKPVGIGTIPTKP